MKRFFSMTGIIVISLSMLLSCGGSENTGDKKATETEKISESKKVIETEKMRGSQIEATFDSFFCMHEECNYIFKQKDGESIWFQDNGETFEYDLVIRDQGEENAEFVGKTFIINYEFVEGKEIDDITGEIETGHNRILSIKLKS